MGLADTLADMGIDIEEEEFGDGEPDSKIQEPIWSEREIEVPVENKIARLEAQINELANKATDAPGNVEEIVEHMRALRARVNTLNIKRPQFLESQRKGE